MELANIINPKLYGSGSMNRERHAMIYGREIARNVIDVIFCHYELVGESDKVADPKSSLVLPYLAQQAKCLLVYKGEAVKLDARSDNVNCTYEAVVNAFRRYCINNTEVLETFNSCESFETFAWAGPTWTVRPRRNPSVPECKQTVSF
jgi:hypothetical protein